MIDKEEIEKINAFLDKIFEDTFENEEGELYILLALLNYMAGYLRGKDLKTYGIGSFLEEKSDLMTPNMLTPKGWSFEKTYIHLYFLFKKLNIEADVDFDLGKIESFINISNKGEKKKVIYETKNPLLEDFINKGNTKVFFKEPVFLYLEDKYYQWIELKNDFDTDENIEKILKAIDEKVANFVSEELSEKYGLYSFNKQKEILLDKMAINQNIFGSMFRVSEENFWDEGDKNNFAYLHFFTFLLRKEYIKISELYSVEEKPIFHDKGNYLCENEKYSLMVYLDSSFIELLKGWIGVKEKILERIFDKDVKSILIKKKNNGELHGLEAKRSFIGDNNKLIELVKQYPNSDINTKNYNGKTQKYEITEKIKFDKDKKTI